MLRKRTLARDNGNILIMSVIIMALLVATGMGYMRWSSDERWDSEYELATVQAYFLAQTGLIEQGLLYLRTRSPTDLPQGTVFLPPKTVTGVGSYLNATVRRVTELGSGDVFQRTDTYDLFCTGRTEFMNHQLGSRGYGTKMRVERTAKMRARLRSFANYMYLTNFEATKYNEIIWFWTYDSLWGRTHSNDFIGLKYSPHFYGPISTSKDKFLYNSPSGIYFKYPPIFNAPPVMFPTTAKTLRAGAQEWIDSRDGRMMTRLRMKGDGGIEVHQYPLGTTPKDSLIKVINPLGYGGIFVDGQCEVEGVVSGNMSIGSSGDMWLIDNIRYDGANIYNGWFVESEMQHMLGLISEQNIIIRCTVENGKSEDDINDGWRGGSRPQMIDKHSIIIDAGMVALGESFTFQYQNDDWAPGYEYVGPTPDERGIIHLKGAVTQTRRGYVHRSNHVGTGYGKDYHYDFRFDERPPPFYLEALDDKGHGLFDIVTWSELPPKK